VDGAKGSAGANVAGDDVPIFLVFEEIFLAFDGEIVVGSAMGAIAAAIVLLAHFIRNRIEVILRLHRLMEGGIEDGDGLGFRQRFLESVEANKVGRGVERIERDQFGDLSLRCPW
jgi:hypothetical protein